MKSRQQPRWQRPTWLLIASAVILFSFPAKACEFSFRVYNFPPYSYKTEQQQWAGSDVALMRRVADSINCNLQLLELPFGRAMKMMKTGQLDSMLQLTKLSSREDYISFVGPVRQEHMRLITQTDVPFIIYSLKQIRDIPGQIAMQRDTFISHEFDRFMSNDDLFRSKVMQALGDANISELLFTDRVLGYIGDQHNLIYRMENEPRFGRLKLHPLIFNDEVIYLGISKQSPINQKLVEAANNIIEQPGAP